MEAGSVHLLAVLAEISYLLFWLSLMPATTAWIGKTFRRRCRPLSVALPGPSVAACARVGSWRPQLGERLMQLA
jgi:hypothetical protein